MYDGSCTQCLIRSWTAPLIYFNSLSSLPFGSGIYFCSTSLSGCIPMGSHQNIITQLLVLLVVKSYLSPACTFLYYCSSSQAHMMLHVDPVSACSVFSIWCVRSHVHMPAHMPLLFMTLIVWDTGMKKMKEKTKISNWIDDYLAVPFFLIFR